MVLINVPHLQLALQFSVARPVVTMPIAVLLAVTLVLQPVVVTAILPVVIM